MYHPPRGGVRGGRDQFNWEDVKTDKHRENYLGHSLFAPVGRWQKGKDLTWYSKNGKSEQAYRDELNAIKDAEADVMAEFLGAGKRKKVTENVTQQELSNVLKREQEDDDDDEILKEAEKDATKGLGFRSFGRLHIEDHWKNKDYDEHEYKRDEREYKRDEREHKRDEREHKRDEREHKKDEHEHKKHEREHKKHEREHKKDKREHKKDKRKHKRDEREYKRDEREYKRDEHEHKRDERERKKDEHEHKRDRKKLKRH